MYVLVRKYVPYKKYVLYRKYVPYKKYVLYRKEVLYRKCTERQLGGGAGITLTCTASLPCTPCLQLGAFSPLPPSSGNVESNI